MQKKKTLNKTEYIRNASEQSANKLFWYLSKSFKANEVNLYDNKQTNTHKTLCLLWAALQASGQFPHVRNKVFLCKFKPLSWFNDDCVTLRDVSVSCSEISSNTTRAQRRTRRLHFRATKLFIAYLLSPVCAWFRLFVQLVFLFLMWRAEPVTHRGTFPPNSKMRVCVMLNRWGGKNRHRSW